MTDAPKELSERETNPHLRLLNLFNRRTFVCVKTEAEECLPTEAITHDGFMSAIRAWDSDPTNPKNVENERMRRRVSDSVEQNEMDEVEIARLQSELSITREQLKMFDDALEMVKAERYKLQSELSALREKFRQWVIVDLGMGKGRCNQCDTIWSGDMPEVHEEGCLAEVRDTNTKEEG